MQKSNDTNGKPKNVYDDGDIPKVDLPHNRAGQCVPNDADYTAQPLPETTRPRKDGPGGA